MNKHDNNTTPLSQEIMQKITQQKIAPKPRWYFTCKNLILWASGAGLLLVGALSVSLMIFIVSGNAWEMRQVIGESPFGHFIQIFPFLWLVAFVVFLITAEHIIGRTKGAYRHSAIKMSLAILLLSIILGSILHILKVSHMADDTFGKHAPRLYKTLDQRRDGVLHRPGKGRIMGVVQSIDEDGDSRTFVIMHPRKEHELMIDARDIPQDKYTLVRVGEKLLIIGKPAEKGIFHAKDIHPLEALNKKLRKILRTKPPHPPREHKIIFEQ